MTVPTSQKTTNAEELTPTQRMLEAAEILATAILRQKKSAQESGFSTGHMPPTERSCTTQ